MRSVLCSVLLCGVAFGAAAQEREVTFEEPRRDHHGVAVGRADYDRVARTNSFTAGKIGLSLFKPVETPTCSRSSRRPRTAARPHGNRQSAGELDAPDRESLDPGVRPVRRADRLRARRRAAQPHPHEFFQLHLRAPGKLTGVELHYTASPRLEAWAIAANGWDVTVDNNRGKTALVGARYIPIPW